MSSLKFLIGLGVRLAVLLTISFCLAPGSEKISGWLRAADRDAQTGQIDRAILGYDRLLQTNCPEQPIYQRLLDLSLNVGRMNDARVYLYALVDQDVWTNARRDELQAILRQSGSGGAGTIEETPGDPLQVAHDQIARLDWSQAQLTLETLLKTDPSNAEALYLLGLILAPSDQEQAASYLSLAATNADWSDRARTVQAALNAYDSYSLTDAHTYLGVTLVGMGEWALAEHAFELALQANAVNPLALAYRGFVRDQQGRDGLPDLQNALAMAPADPTVYYLLGQHWRRGQDQETAYEMFVQAYWLAPDNPALAAEVGLSLQLSGDFAGAEEWFRIAVDLAPDDVQWQSALAAFYADTGYQVEEGGLEAVQTASERFPDDPDIRTSLGWAYYLAGQTDKAYQELNKALGLDPSLPRTSLLFRGGVGIPGGWRRRRQFLSICRGDRWPRVRALDCSRRGRCSAWGGDHETTDCGCGRGFARVGLSDGAVASPCWTFNQHDTYPYRYPSSRKCAVP